jgi:hypothetical protein
MTEPETNEGFTKAEALNLYDVMLQRLISVGNFRAELEGLLDHYHYQLPPQARRRLERLKECVERAEEAGSTVMADIDRIADPFVTARAQRRHAREEAAKVAA